jgi:hypothetical protein
MAIQNFKQLIVNVVHISADCALHTAEAYVHYDAWAQSQTWTPVIPPSPSANNEHRCCLFESVPRGCPVLRSCTYLCGYGQLILDLLSGQPDLKLQRRHGERENDFESSSVGMS